MAKIIRIKDGLISIGKDDGTFFDVEQKDIDFCPNIGDEVDVFSANGRMIVSKVNKPKIPQKIVYQESEVSGKIVNQIVYVLLAVFLGDIGAHKFYAGKMGLGIVYLLFCWTFIPGLVGLIEGIIAISKKTDSEGNIVV